MGGLQVHNHATSWPNLQDGTCRDSIQIELQVGPEFGKKSGFIYKVHYNQNDQLERMISTHKSVLKIGIGSQFIRQNVKQFENLVLKVKFRHTYINIWGCDAYFSKPALKP